MLPASVGCVKPEADRSWTRLQKKRDREHDINRPCNDRGFAVFRKHVKWGFQWKSCLSPPLWAQEMLPRDLRKEVRQLQLRGHETL